MTEIKTEVDHKGKQRRLYRAKCKCCRQCWAIEGTNRCIYGGPYSGYTQVPTMPQADQQQQLGSMLLPIVSASATGISKDIIG